MKISRLRAHRLDDVPMQPPPLHDAPSSTSVVLIEVETDDGLTGWSLAGFAHVTMADFVNNSPAEHVMVMAALAKAFNVPIGHGNGSGPANIALQAGVPNGTIVEYHLNRWNGYNAIFHGVPQPHDGMLTVSTEPGTGMVPVDGLVEEFGS